MELNTTLQFAHIIAHTPLLNH